MKRQLKRILVGRSTLARRAHKQKSSLLLIILLLLLLILCWGFSLFREPAGSAVPHLAQTGPVVDIMYRPPKTVRVERTIRKGVEVYRGMLSIPNCDTLATQMSVAETEGAAVSLAFVLAKSGDACSDAGTSPVPFAVSYASHKVGTSTLAGVTINSHSIPFSVVNKK